MASDTKSLQYQGHKKRQRQRWQKISEIGRDIGIIPPVANAARKIAALSSFKVFCETYCSKTFFIPWGHNHLEVIKKIEQTVMHGGLFALALPRGEGKTSLCEAAVIWAALAGHRRFVVFIGSDEAHAESALADVKSELECNDLLAMDFPEALFPIRQLEGIALRAHGQTYQGQRLRSEWSRKQLILPTIAGSASAGTIVKVAGLEGSIRGMSHKRPDGRIVRPDLVIIDDPQTDESARSPSQVATRERILMGAILGLAGHGKAIAAVVPCTVICKDDLADRILDRQRSPRWQGQRYKMLNAMPTSEKLWAEYAVIQVDDLQSGGTGALATEFYRANREAMDAGAEVAWPERYDPDEISAVQHAMNLKLRDEGSFLSEYQNEPKADVLKKLDLSASDVIKKTNGIERGIVPTDVTMLTMFTDVQEKVLFYAVVGWTEQFTGYVVEYGTVPDQQSGWFTLREPKAVLTDLAPGSGMEGSITAGLKYLDEHVVARGWPGDDGKVYRINRCLIDANWGQSTDAVYNFCHRSPNAAVLVPSHGRYVGASSKPMSEYTRKPGDRLGTNWRIPREMSRRPIAHIVYDTNYWKSFVHARFLTVEGDPGCLSMWGRDPKVHELFANHMTAEYYVRTTGRNREVNEWKQRPDHPDNHWFDCIVGCCVGASMEGAMVPGQTKSSGGSRKRERISLAALQRAKRSRGAYG